MLTAPLKVRVTIWGRVLSSSLPPSTPGAAVPSAEQKQSGREQSAGSHTSALLGSSSTLHAFSSLPSLQSAFLSQKSSWRHVTA